MKNNQKGFASLILVGIIIVLVALVVWYLGNSGHGFINISNYESSMVPDSDVPISSENIWINISMYPPGKYNNFLANETLES